MTAPPEKPEVTVPFKNDLMLADGIVHRTRRLPMHTRVVDGIRVTSLERSLLDYSAVTTEFELECAIEVVLQRHLTTEERLWIVLVTDGGRGLAGCAQFRRVLENRPEGRPARSVLETLMSRLLRSKNVTGFVRDHRVTVDDETSSCDPSGSSNRSHSPAHPIVRRIERRACNSTHSSMFCSADAKRGARRRLVSESRSCC